MSLRKKAYDRCLDVLRDLCEKYGAAIVSVENAKGSHRKATLAVNDKRIVMTVYPMSDSDQRVMLNYKRDARRRILTELLGRNA